MAAIMHVAQVGHKCRKPSRVTTPASYIKAGDMLEINGWIVSYNPRQAVYVVHRNQYPYAQFDYYEFHNFNCAAAKLVELGEAK